jgi:hypothetical protein
MSETKSERPLNSCHLCGGTAYRPVVARNEKGVMQPTGEYQCVQCKLAFTDVRSWRSGIDAGPARQQPAAIPGKGQGASGQGSISDALF